MNILIVGLGVIGTTYGHLFQKAEHEVEHLVRPGSSKADVKSFHVELLDGRLGEKGVRWTSTYEIRACTRTAFDLIFVSVPSGAVESVVQDLDAAGITGTLLVCCGIWEDRTFIEQTVGARPYLLGYPVAGGSIQLGGNDLGDSASPESPKPSSAAHANTLQHSTAQADAPQTCAPQASALQHGTQSASPPQHGILQTSTLQSGIPQHGAVQTIAPQVDAPQHGAAQVDAPQASAPQHAAAQTTALQADTPRPDALLTSTPHPTPTHPTLSCCVFDHFMLESRQKAAIPHYDDIANLFADCGIELECPHDMLEWIWLHMAINAAVISVAGRHGDVTDTAGSAERLMGSEGLLNEAVRAIRETSKIVESRGVDLRNYRNELAPYLVPLGISAPAMKRMFATNELTRKIMTLHGNTDDLLYVCRSLYRAGKDAGIAAPVFYTSCEAIFTETSEQVRACTFETPSGSIRYWVDDSAGADAPWLVFLPGLTADHTLFTAQMTHFSGTANYLVWDAPAHGKSRPFALDFTMDDLARMLHAILEAEGIASPVLVGQSMGGYISQAFIDLFPGEAAGFVSIDSSTLKRSYYPDWEVAFLRHTKAMYRSIPWPLLKPWGAVGAAATPQGRANMRSFMDSYERREYCDLTAFGYRVLADALDSRRAYDIDCPVLLLCGERDNAGDVRAFNRAWTAGEGIPLVWVPGAGHNANVDNPDFVNDQIARFLASL